MDNKRKLEEQNIEVSISDSRQVKSQQTGTIILGSGKRWCVFIYILIVNILINFDHGYFPAATEEFKRDFHIDEDLLGLFGSAVYFGNLLGIYNHFNIRLFNGRVYYK
jgi:hypothetical protein